MCGGDAPHDADLADGSYFAPTVIDGVDPDSTIAQEAWSTQERFCYTHEWLVGDVVIWDNTGILHRALPYDPSSERTMHRTTIAGDEAWS